MIGPQIHAPLFPDGASYDAIRTVYGDPRPLLRVTNDLTDENERAWRREILSPLPVPFPKPVGLVGSPLPATRAFVHRTLFEEALACFTELFTRDAWRHIEDFAGCYRFRLIRGGTQPSLHSWAAALDFNAARYPLGTEPDPKDPFVREVVPVFKERGWVWGGDFSRPDPMHFQATKESSR